MAMGMQQTSISSMVVGAQYMGNNLGNETVHSQQHESTQMQWTYVNSRAVSIQWTNDGPRAQTILFYPQDPRETQGTGDDPRATSAQPYIYKWQYCVMYIYISALLQMCSLAAISLAATLVRR